MNGQDQVPFARHVTEPWLDPLGLCVAALLSIMAGCSKNAPSASPRPAVSPQVAAKADGYINGWATSGMWLPDRNQVQFFRNHFEQVQSNLERALSSSDEHVRRGAAYVVGELAKQATACGPKLLEQLKTEPERLVRMYIYSALAAIEFRTSDVVAELNRRYSSLSSENTGPKDPSFEYAEVDERIDLAATLYVLDAGPDKEQYLQFVQQWLHPPAADLSGEQLEGFWERRWIAVASSERMKGARSSIPLLEAMLDEGGSRMWVGVHVPRVLDALR
jgi:hypothetical protein